MSTAAPTEDVSAEQQGLPKSHFLGASTAVLSTIIVAGIFASTLAQPQVLGQIPLQHILKYKLHATPEGMARFTLIIGLFWYLKPLWGILTDAFPLFGTRRRYYMLFGSAIAAISWLILGTIPQTYNSLVAGCIFLSASMVMISTVTGAILVEIGQSRGATGRLTSVRQVTQNTCTLIQGPFGGFLAGQAFLLTAGVNALIVVSVFPAVFFLLKERPVATKNTQAIITAGRQMKVLFSNSTFWLAIVFIALFYFAPGLGALTYFRQHDVMGIDDQHIGYLGSFGGGAGIAAAFLYGFLARRFRLSALITFGVTTAGLGTLFYLKYNNYALAIPIDTQNGFFFAFAEVSLIDLAARATPAGCEGLGYSFILSVRNLSVFGANWVGAFLSKTQHWDWGRMVEINAGTTLVVLILLPFMPKRLMGSRDGVPNSENTGEPEMEPA